MKNYVYVVVTHYSTDQMELATDRFFLTEETANKWIAKSSTPEYFNVRSLVLSEEDR